MAVQELLDGFAKFNRIAAVVNQLTEETRMTVMPGSNDQLRTLGSLNIVEQILALSEEAGLSVAEVTAAFAQVGPSEFDVRQHLQAGRIEREIRDNAQRGSNT